MTQQQTTSRQTTSRQSASRPTGAPRRSGRLIFAVTVVAVVGFAVLIAASITPPDRSVFDESLPNPMGGTARTAPGEVTGDASFGGLEVAGTEVAMGDVALDVTYVPGWEVTNPSDEEIPFAIGMPQVVEGCCPGPVYVDGELTQVGQPFTIEPGGSVLVQFPLQMHRGMDGPHHLTLPLAAGGEQTSLHVTGDFSPDVART